MVDYPEAKKPPKKSRTGRSKVKSGCRTCKIRRVKCDESRPCCKRCISTGRICDGYGIWGGGGNGYRQRSSCNSNSSTENSPSPVTTDILVSRNNIPTSLTVTCMSTHEQYCFKWFMDHTVKNFPGLHPSPFWQTLVCQASSSEPAVLHAMLALSSAHRKDGLDNPIKMRNTPDTLEQFMLQQYSIAISHLQPHFLARSKDSIRVALVTCLLFIYTEFICGHYRTANTHLRSGLRLLREVQEQDRSSDDITLKPCRNFVDDCITDTFVRLQVQAILCGETFPNLNFLPIAIEPDIPDAAPFQSIAQARQSLDRLSRGIFHLTENSLHDGTCSANNESSSDHQQRIQAALSSWSKRYTAYQATLGPPSQLPIRDQISHGALLLYHTLSTIMSFPYLSSPSPSQTIFDTQLPNFLKIITLSITVRKVIMTNPVRDIIPNALADASDAIAEVGWIPPLYYTAIKCRNHRIRTQAARLLGSLPHKEGMWDATIWAVVAREVIAVEEGEFYDEFHLDDEFELCSEPKEKDILVPMVPEGRRVSEVRVVLPDCAEERVVVICRRKGEDGGWEEVVRECDVVPQARVVKPGRSMYHPA